MDAYRIIVDENALDSFLVGLSPLKPHEVWYVCLFGRHKYDKSFPNSKDSGQLARIVARDAAELKEKLRRMETPIGSYSRDGVVASQSCLAVYITVNPRSLIKANKDLLIELASRFTTGSVDFNPTSLSTTCIHRAIDRKFYIDFDFDDFDDADLTACLAAIWAVLPDQSMFRILRTRGGFHLLVTLDAIRDLKTNWHQTISQLPGCDVRGSNAMMPVPGCTQGGFTPYFIRGERFATEKL